MIGKRIRSIYMHFLSHAEQETKATLKLLAIAISNTLPIAFDYYADSSWQAATSTKQIRRINFFYPNIFEARTAAIKTTRITNKQKQRGLTLLFYTKQNKKRQQLENKLV